MGVLNDNIVGGAAGVSTGQETYAPSSNDWDYTYAQNEWPAAGNTLGDDSDGGYIYNTGGDSGISSLFTFDGDFDITWTATGASEHLFGVHAIDEDDTRTTDNRGGMKSMTNSFMWESGGTNPKDFFIGSSAQSDTNTFAAGSVIKIERVSGTIKVYDDGVVVHTYGTTYTGTLRFWIGAPGAPFNLNYDDILFTDSEGVQRDGFINEDTSAYPSFGDRHVNEKCIGARRRATRTGNVASVKFNVQAAGIASSAVHCEVWSDNGGSPGSQIGSDSASITVDSTGIKTFTFSGTGPEVAGGKAYWYVFVDGGNGDLNIFVHADAAHAGLGSGKHDTITSIVDNVTGEYSIEVQIETTEEPKPDWDTLLLIHSDTSDASTTFVDSSQYNRTLTANGNVQHDTAQKKFSASSILFDGTGDYLTAVDSPDWNFRDRGRGATVDFWCKTSFGTSQGIMSHNTGDPVNNWDFYQRAAGHLVCLGYSVSGGNGSTNVTTTSVINDGNWNHLAYSWDGVTLRVAFNGTWQDSKNFTDPFQDIATVLQIGKAVSVTTTFDGHLDEIRISNVARWDHSANFTPPTSPYP